MDIFNSSFLPSAFKNQNVSFASVGENILGCMMRKVLKEN